MVQASNARLPETNGDAGNSADTAQAIGSLVGLSDVLVDGSVGFGDDRGDYFSFVAPLTATATFSLTGLADDLALTLRKGDGSRVISSNNAGTESELLTYPLAAGNTYFLQVAPPSLSSEAASSYQLGIALPDASEQVNGSSIGDAGNDTATATAISTGPGFTAISGSMGLPDDTGDYFRFTAGATGTAQVELAGLTQDLDLRVFDGAGSLIASSSLGGVQADTAEFAVALGSDYIVGVTPYAGGISRYDLSLELPGNSDRVDGEPIGDAGDTKETAAALGELSDSVEIDGNVGDGADAADVYTLTAAAGGRLGVQLAGLQADLDLSILDAAGQVLAAGNVAGTAGEAVAATVAAGQTVYLQVAPFQSAQSDYRLDVTLDAFTVPTEGGETAGGVALGDAGGSPDSATLIYPDDNGGIRILGSVGGNDADDYFQFTPQGSGQARLLLFNMDQNLDLRLYDASGALIADSTFSGTAPEQLDYFLTAGTTYLLRVDPSSIAASDYEMTLALPTAPEGYRVFDPNNDGLLFDAIYQLDSGEIISADAAQVYRTYAGALARTPDEGGYDWWLGEVLAGRYDTKRMAEGFLYSEEFLGFFPGAEEPDDITYAAFVEHMYENVFGRKPDDDGFVFWVNELESGERDMADVLVDMTYSNEFVGITGPGLVDFIGG